MRVRIKSVCNHFLFSLRMVGANPEYDHPDDYLDASKGSLNSEVVHSEETGIMAKEPKDKVREFCSPAVGVLICV